jgi:hypothetical protein
MEFRRLESIAMRSVFRWLSKRFPKQIVSENERFPDYVVSDPELGKKLGFEVKTIREPRHLQGILSDQKYRAYHEVNEGYLDEITFVFVMLHQEGLDRVTQILERTVNQLPLGVKLILGIANMENEDELTADFYPVIELEREA